MLDDDGTMRVGSGNKERKNRKVKFHEAFDEGHDQSHQKNVKRVMLSLTKPSYTLGLGLKKIRTENCARLSRLLCKLMRQHNWTEATGVLSVLLKGTPKNSSPTENRIKYSITMELLTHVEIGKINPTKIKRLYETWMRRTGSMECWPVELWYSTIPEEMQLRDSEEPYIPTQPDKSMTRFCYPVENSAWSNAVSFHEIDAPAQSNSCSSVMNNKEKKLASGDANLLEEGSVRGVIDLQRGVPAQANHAQGFYINSAEDSADEKADSFNLGDNLLYGSIFSGQEWDVFLLPLRLPRSTRNCEDFISLHKDVFNDQYKGAVKHLRLALYSTPSIVAALLPLIQLLLIVGEVKEALNELEKFCCNSNSALPFRLRASILERLGGNSSTVLSTSFEDSLRKDPTCSSSLAKLASMRQNGHYDIESLLEMIALHLDATYADHVIWREFALCFFKLSHYEEDRVSCLHGNEGGVDQGCAVRFNTFSPRLIKGKSGKAWRFRCRWWLTRHFSKTKLASEIASGDWQLLTYKAACASHMYGCEFEYVAKAINYLEEENDGNLLLFLRRHMHSAVGFYKHTGRK